MLPSCLKIDNNQYLWSQLEPQEAAGDARYIVRLKRTWSAASASNTNSSSAQAGVVPCLQIRGVAETGNCFPGQSPPF